MASTPRIGLIALLAAASFSGLGFSRICLAQETLISQLATWDTAPTGSIFPGGDFDPQLDKTASCSGCWYGNPNNASGITYSNSTAQKTQGTGSLKAVITGKGAGGTYSVNINGSPVTLQTHFDDPLLVTYSNSTAANGGVLDPRFTALNDAINSGKQSQYNIEFDIIYDVASMRAIPWQPPIETVNPDPNNGGAYPQRFFWTGSFGQGNDSFQFVGFDANTINPFSSQYDTNMFPVFHASFPLSAFNFLPDATPGQHTFRTLGILYNSVFGTAPPSSNTSSVNVYFDNLRLMKINPAALIDYNNNGSADPADWSLFMGQYLVSTPPTPPNPNTSFDLVGGFGAAGTNGKVDFADLQKFQELYTLAHSGAAASSFPWATGSVPEPGTLALCAIALVGLITSRARRYARPALTLAATLLLVLVHQSAHAQLLESWETLGKWGVNPGAAAGTAPTVALATIGATQGTKSFQVSANDTNPIGGFSWNAATTPTNFVAGDPFFDALAHAVRVGAENYNLLIDTTFNPADLPGVNSLQVTLGLNFVGQNAGLYSGEASQFTTTSTIPLSSFNLPDTVDQGATNYSAEIGFTATADVDRFSAYVDNIRLQQISTPDLLTLQIDRSTGAGILKNLSANPISWNLLDIKSAGGALKPTGWSSLADQNADGAGTWVEAGGSSSTELAEASLLGSHTLAAGASFPIGTVLNNSNHAEDLGFVIRKAAGPTNRTYDQNVVYINSYPAGIPGDYNGNGIVDAADYTVWRDHQGQTFTLQNRDTTNSGAINTADYTFWKSHFGNHAGAGAGLGAGGAVPEPSSLVLCLCGIAAAWIAQRSKIV